MQKVNVNTPITITGRHVEVTDAIREFVTKKIEGIRLDFPRIMEVKVLLDAQDFSGNPVLLGSYHH